MESVNIRVGSTEASSGGTTYNSRKLIMHPQYNAANSDYDVAVIKLSRNIAIDGTNSTTATLPSGNCTVPADTNLTVTGWGDTSVSVHKAFVLYLLVQGPRTHVWLMHLQI